MAEVNCHTIGPIGTIVPNGCDKRNVTIARVTMGVSQLEQLPHTDKRPVRQIEVWFIKKSRRSLELTKNFYNAYKPYT